MEQFLKSEREKESIMGLDDKMIQDFIISHTIQSRLDLINNQIKKAEKAEKEKAEKKLFDSLD